jgi:hypothetical protein
VHYRVGFLGAEAILCIYPALMTSVWLWLYAVSRFILKGVISFNFGLRWFNTHLNIKDKPILCIGIVAASLTAIGYWLDLFIG